MLTELRNSEVILPLKLRLSNAPLHRPLTLPKKRLLKCFPLQPRAIKSTPSLSATVRISSAGRPHFNMVLTLTPFFSRAFFDSSKRLAGPGLKAYPSPLLRPPGSFFSKNSSGQAGMIRCPQVSSEPLKVQLLNPHFLPILHLASVHCLNHCCHQWRLKSSSVFPGFLLFNL